MTRHVGRLSRLTCCSEAVVNADEQGVDIGRQVARMPPGWVVYQHHAIILPAKTPDDKCREPLLPAAAPRAHVPSAAPALR